MTIHRHPSSPVLDHCPETLPAHAYYDAGWYEREQKTIWARNWVAAGRLNDMACGQMKRVQVGAASVILCRDADGELSAFHNVCRHRGAELCSALQQPMGKFITCRYHAWSYAARDGRLMATGHANPTNDFRKEEHGLLPVSVTVWNGFVFLNLDADPRPLAPDLGLAALGNWPMAGLVTGHRMETEIACNWKIFWENYNECLHCPGIHPKLCEMVPVYGSGVMAHNEAPGWSPQDAEKPNMREGAETWTASGKPCGPVFPDLTAAQRLSGYTFVTVFPTTYIVAHVDYVRAVRIEPAGPERMRLAAEWYFPAETLAQPGFDAADVAGFASMVMQEDAEAAELNQRGLRSPAYKHGRLMPEEYAIRDFKAWVLREMAEG